MNAKYHRAWTAVRNFYRGVLSNSGRHKVFEIAVSLAFWPITSPEKWTCLSYNCYTEYCCISIGIQNQHSKFNQTKTYMIDQIDSHYVRETIIINHMVKLGKCSQVLRLPSLTWDIFYFASTPCFTMWLIMMASLTSCVCLYFDIAHITL